MGVHFDASEVNALALDLTEARGRIQRSAPQVLKVGAYKIKQEMQQEFSGHRHLPHLGDKVSYERLDENGLSYEIGIDKIGQGHLGNIAAYGTSNNAPVADKNVGLRKEAPEVERRLLDKGAESVFGRE